MDLVQRKLYYRLHNREYSLSKLYRWAAEFSQGLAVLGGMGWGGCGNRGSSGVRPEVSRWLGWCLGPVSGPCVWPCVWVEDCWFVIAWLEPKG